MRKLKKILLGLLVVLVVMQFIRIDKTNPVSDPQNDFMQVHQPPQDLAGILKTSCYDCHSNETVYPWYTNIAPVSYWIKYHINDGRKHLNFSEWKTYNNKRAHHKLEECYEMVLEGHMPLPSYLWVHKEASLSSDQQKALASWFEEQMVHYPQEGE